MVFKLNSEREREVWNAAIESAVIAASKSWPHHHAWMDVSRIMAGRGAAAEAVAKLKRKTKIREV